MKAFKTLLNFLLQRSYLLHTPFPCWPWSQMCYCMAAGMDWYWCSL